MASTAIIILLALCAVTFANPFGPPIIDDPCDPYDSASPCGTNAVCEIVDLKAVCSCPPNTAGNPYVACTQECATHSDCPPHQACLTSTCVDPCIMACGENTYCEIVNHQAVCRCAHGYEGDPFVKCVKGICAQSPCGENARCEERNKEAICTCPPQMIGNPLVSCQEKGCTADLECPEDKACIDTKCADPCVRACGDNAVCNVLQHKAVCSCLEGYEGNPLEGCTPTKKLSGEACSESPCGANAVCEQEADTAYCSCSPGTFGDPLVSCKTYCSADWQCKFNLACFEQECKDPCVGICAEGAECTVINHQPQCSCPPGKTGDPYYNCN